MIRPAGALVVVVAVSTAALGLPVRAGAHETAFPAAVCACQAVAFTGSANTDSYDSREGGYDPIAAGAGGNVAANGDVQLAGSVAGDVVAGGNVTGSGTVTGDIVAGGTVAIADITVAGTVVEHASPVPAPCACENGLDVDALAAEAALSNDNGAMGSCAPFLAGTSFDIGGSNACVLPPGRYYLTMFRVRGLAAVLIAPSASAEQPVELVLAGAGPFDLGGTGLVNATEHAQAALIYSASAAELRLHGSADFVGLVDAPRALATIGSSDVYGALTVDTLQTGGLGDLHYDEASAERDDYCPSDRDGDGLCDDDDPRPGCGGIAAGRGARGGSLLLVAVTAGLLARRRARAADRGAR